MRRYSPQRRRTDSSTSVPTPGSGKTTIAAERYGYLRYQRGDTRGVLGLTFNRAAAAQLRRRIHARWAKTASDPRIES